MSIPSNKELSPIPDVVEEILDRRQEVLDNMGWSPDQIRRATEDVSSLTSEAESRTSFTRTMPVKRRGRGPYNEGSDADRDPYWNGNIEVTEEELAQAAAPEAPGRLAALAVAAAIAREAVKRKAAERGREHYASALERAAYERRTV